ncbi:MAG TPA: NAD(+) diphosphatase, partial [Solirubrobacteraceae bacterium]|nr:NAD(+) diphosphatase [Solirubrobacteraceae bacterium]
MAAPNTFAGGTLDRAATRRADGAWVAAQERHPAARAVVGDVSGVLAAGDAPALVPLGALSGEPVLLGLDADGPLFAVDLADLAGARAGAADAWTPRGSWVGDAGPGRAADVPGAPDDAAFRGLRDLAPGLGAADAGLLAHAAALLHWRRTSRHCGRCGGATEAREAGHVRACTACGLQIHPRTDPVVIMLVTDGDRVLLGRQPSWPAGRFSALAGFVEPGESLEAAVAREVREEAGVDVGAVRYVSSQPWPFPASLMMGFEAEWAGGEAAVADAELEAVRWCTARELEAARDGAGELQLPGPQAIARRLVEGWLDGRASGSP